jgi:hypothetical protein
MILQQALALGADRLRGRQDRRHLLGARSFPNTCCCAGRRGAGFGAVMVICVLASLSPSVPRCKVDPAEAIGG